MILTLVAVTLLVFFWGSMEFCSDVGGLNSVMKLCVFCREFALWRFAGDFGVWILGFWILVFFDFGIWMFDFGS